MHAKTGRQLGFAPSDSAVLVGVEALAHRQHINQHDSTILTARLGCHEHLQLYCSHLNFADRSNQNLEVLEPGQLGHFARPAGFH